MHSDLANASLFVTLGEIKLLTCQRICQNWNNMRSHHLGQLHPL